MDGNALLDAVRSETETELSRLNSSRAVYALTDGEMDAESVRTGAATEAAALAAALDAAAEAADGEAGDALGDAAARLHDLAAAVGDPPADPETATAESVGAAADPLAAAAGALLTLSTRAEQLVGFFVGNADPAGADEFRTLRDAAAENRDAIAALAAGGDDSVADAVAVVDAAYDEYVDVLESLGVEPKNVC